MQSAMTVQTLLRKWRELLKLFDHSQLEGTTGIRRLKAELIYWQVFRRNYLTRRIDSLIRNTGLLVLMGMLVVSSCAKKENAEATQPSTEPAKPTAAAPAQPSTGPRAVIHLKSGTDLAGAIVASSQTDMVVASDDGVEHKIPLNQIKSVDYGETAPKQASAEPAPKKTPVREQPAPAQRPPVQEPPEQPVESTSPLTPAPIPRPVTTKTYELPAGSEVSVRTDEPIDSSTAAEGQTFDVQVTRDATDANGDVVIPRGSRGKIVIKSASKGGRFKGASDLVLDLQSVTINGKPYFINSTDVAKTGKSGVGANKRTAVYTGGGAALGAIIGAIAGGGKGAAIGAGAGAGAGALTQIFTKGKSIKVPVESVLTFNLDKPLQVTAAQ